MATREVLVTNTIEIWKDQYNLLTVDVGDVSTLNTTAKTSLVLAANEVNTLATGLDTRVGALSVIDVAIRQTSVTASVQSFYAAYATFVGATNTTLGQHTTGLAAINTLVGTKTNLHNAIKTAIAVGPYTDDIVAAINFVYSIGIASTVSFNNISAAGTITAGGAGAFGGGLTVSGGNFVSRGITDQATTSKLVITDSAITMAGNTSLTGNFAASGTLAGTGLTVTTITSTGVWSQNNAAPQITMIDSDAGTNLGRWIETWNTGVYTQSLQNDAANANTTVYTITRTAHTSAIWNFGSAITVRINGNDVWHVGNDGAGSTMDADLLDGQHGAYYADIAARLGYTPLNTTAYTAADVLAKLITVDGTGTGLDADLLDGQEGSYYTNIAGRLGYTPLNAATYTAADILTKLLTVDGIGSGLDADLLDGQSSAYYTAIAARLGYTPFSSAGGTITGATVISEDLTVYRSVSTNTSVIYLNQGQTRYLNYDGTKYILASADLHVNGSKVWTQGNDGTSSGLDADVVRGTTPSADGLAILSASYASTKGNMGLGNVENKSSATIRSEISSANVTSGLGYTPLNAASYTAADVLAKLVTVDGSGSGLDADALDGQDSSFYTNIPGRLGYTPFANTGGTLFGSLAVSGSISSTGDITGLTSDNRLKIIQGKIENPLVIIRNLSGYYFKWNQIAIDRTPSLDGVKNRAGLMADDIEKFFPEAMGDEIEGYRTVRYEAMIPVFVEAIKALQDEIAVLRAELRAK